MRITLGSAQSIFDMAIPTFGFGAWVGHRIAKRRNNRALERRTLQELVWAVGGRPESPIGPRVPGLVEVVSVLADRVGLLETKVHDGS